jgi:hypothetical protein
MRVRFSNLHHCRNKRISKSRRYERVQSRPKLTVSHPTKTDAFCNYSDNAVAELTEYLPSKSSPESLPTISSRLMLDGLSLGPGTNKYTPQEGNKGRRLIWRDRNVGTMACAVCGEDLELTHRGERAQLFSCRCVSHEACFYKVIRVSESRYCQMCGASLAPATGSLIPPTDRGKRLEGYMLLASCY